MAAEVLPLLLLALSGGAEAFAFGTPRASRPHTAHGVLVTPARAAVSMDFGDTFYEGFAKWAAEYPEEDKVNFPEYFVLPDGIYEVALQRPLGISFEEVEPGRGVKVLELVPGGNAETQGMIKPDDVLIGVTAIKVIGAKFERRLIPCRSLDFDTIIGAIGSNEPRWQCNDVILQFHRPDAAADQVEAYLERIELPADSPWRG